MITKQFLRIIVICSGIAAAMIVSGLAGSSDTFEFAYLSRAEDPFYEHQRAYTGLRLKDRHRPIDGVAVALHDSRIIGRSIGLQFDVLMQDLAPGESSEQTVNTMIRDRGISVFLLDLPLAEVATLGGALAEKKILLFNIRHPEDFLRGSHCSSALFHTIPSYAMHMDALAQFLYKKDWQDILVLEGPEPGDQVLSEAFRQSAKKFGLDLVDTRPFVLSNDPRERGRNNIPLLTRGGGYDVIYLADALGEFGRYVPFNTQQARPVVGSEGLMPGTWHWTLERYGAPQLNQRFRRHAERNMQDLDYAAWAAIRSVVTALTKTKSADIETIKSFLRSDDFSFDTYKGVPGSFRHWDNQLRQPLLLNTFNSVIGIAPIDGFLHQENHLDTLGTDQRESSCKM